MERLFSNKKISNPRKDISGYYCYTCDAECLSTCSKVCYSGCSGKCTAQCSSFCGIGSSK